MSRIWAVARHMIAESIRMKIALVFIGVIVILLPVLPFSLAGDGVTLTSRVQSFLSYSLGSAGFLLSMLTVFLACGALCNEVRFKQIFMLASKPIPRWQFVAGKWLGISLLNAGLLLLTGLTVWGFTWYLKNQPTYREDRLALQNEVLTVRYGAKPDKPDFPAMVAERIRTLREEGRLEEITLAGRMDIEEEIQRELETSWRTLGPGQYRDYKFSGLLVDRESEGFVHLRFKPTNPSGVADIVFNAQWQCGDPKDPNTLMPVQRDDFLVQRFHSIPIAALAVNKEGTLYLRIRNGNPIASITFEGDDSFELLYDVGTFHWNLFRALTIIWSRLAFLAALGLLASSFLSFPVACMVGFLVMVVASCAGFLNDAVAGSVLPSESGDPLWIFGAIIDPISSAFLWLVPDFSKFDPVGTVVAGRVVPLVWVIQSLLKLVVVKAGIVGALGAITFTRRELARVMV